MYKKKKNQHVCGFGGTGPERWELPLPEVGKTTQRTEMEGGVVVFWFGLVLGWGAVVVVILVSGMNSGLRACQTGAVLLSYIPSP